MCPPVLYNLLVQRHSERTLSNLTSRIGLEKFSLCFYVSKGWRNSYCKDSDVATVGKGVSSRGGGKDSEIKEFKKRRKSGIFPLFLPLIGCF